MSWIKRMLGLQAPLPASADTFQPTRDLTMGSLLRLDKGLSRLLAGNSTLVLPGDERVHALGRIELGNDTHLERFYLDDEDYFLQRVMVGNAVEDIILFGYHQVTPISSRDELQRLTGPIGLPLFELEGARYQRQWGAEPGQAGLVPMQEQVRNPQARYRVRHQAMLYARDLDLADRREFLLFSVEEDEQGKVVLSSAVGVTLQTTDFTVT